MKLDSDTNTPSNLRKELLGVGDIVKVRKEDTQPSDLTLMSPVLSIRTSNLSQNGVEEKGRLPVLS